jgi:hypothetical protein
MSTYDDFDGVWFTIQGICLYHREVLADLSFVVIDNHPEGPAAGPLEALGGYVANYRYVPFSGYRGTAVHDLVFHETDAEIVCSLDCHVLLIPGALAAVQSWFADHPDSRDLLQGPILWDDLRSGATQMDPEWREGMYGIWATDPRFGEPEGEPFEIEMHGVGLLACRRAAWPGINPRFRGFGGEEGYVHEKFRRRGGHSPGPTASAAPTAFPIPIGGRSVCATTSLVGTSSAGTSRQWMPISANSSASRRTASGSRHAKWPSIR